MDVLFLDMTLLFLFLISANAFFINSFASQFGAAGSTVYVFASSILLAAGLCRAAMAKNYNARLESKREEKRKKKEQEIFMKESLTTRVTLADSRRAGNCIEGSLQFAEKKLGIDRAEILAGQHLISFPAQILRRVASGDSARVEGAIRAAWNRETLVCI